MKESEISRIIRKQIDGWVFKTVGGKFQMPGIPDIIGCSNDGSFLAIEVKIDKRKHLNVDSVMVSGLSKIQEYVLNDIPGTALVLVVFLVMKKIYITDKFDLNYRESEIYKNSHFIEYKSLKKIENFNKILDSYKKKC